MSPAGGGGTGSVKGPGTQEGPTAGSVPIRLRGGTLNSREGGVVRGPAAPLQLEIVGQRLLGTWTRRFSVEVLAHVLFCPSVKVEFKTFIKQNRCSRPGGDAADLRGGK